MQGAGGYGKGPMTFGVWVASFQQLRWHLLAQVSWDVTEDDTVTKRELQHALHRLAARFHPSLQARDEDLLALPGARPESLACGRARTRGDAR